MLTVAVVLELITLAAKLGALSSQDVSRLETLAQGAEQIDLIGIVATIADRLQGRTEAMLIEQSASKNPHLRK